MTKFLFVANQNSATNVKEFFKHIQDNNLWLGINNNKSLKFRVPNTYNGAIGSDGNKYAIVPAICWFTNIIHNKRNEPIKLGKKYYGNESEYDKYDDQDILNVNKVKDIPEDYYGIMGVPITFLQNYCPEQFDILGATNNSHDNCISFTSYINKKKTYARLLIKRKI